MPGTKQKALKDRFPCNCEKEILCIKVYMEDIIWHKIEMTTWYTEVLYNEVLLNIFFTTLWKWSNFKISTPMRLKVIVWLISWADT